MGLVLIHDDVLDHEVERPFPRVGCGAEGVLELAELDEFLTLGTLCAPWRCCP